MGIEHISTFTTAPLPGTSHPGNGVADRHNWAQLTHYEPDWSELRKAKIVTETKFDPANAALDILRTKVLRLMRSKAWRSVILTSPTAGCGKSVISINLAFSLARVAELAVVLADLDLRCPKVAEILHLDPLTSMEEFLSGAGSVPDAFVSCRGSLAIGSNSSPAADPALLLHSTKAQGAIADIQAFLQPDVLLFDMPPMLECGDVLAFAQNVDCALIVAAAGSSTIAEIEACENELSKVTNVLGVVLNKCRYLPHYGGY